MKRTTLALIFTCSSLSFPAIAKTCILEITKRSTTGTSIKLFCDGEKVAALANQNKSYFSAEILAQIESVKASKGLNVVSMSETSDSRESESGGEYGRYSSETVRVLFSN